MVIKIQTTENIEKLSGDSSQAENNIMHFDVIIECLIDEVTQ